MKNKSKYEGSTTTNGKESAKEWNDRWDRNFAQFAGTWANTSTVRKIQIMKQIGRTLKAEDKING